MYVEIKTKIRPVTAPARSKVKVINKGRSIRIDRRKHQGCGCSFSVAPENRLMETEI